MTTLQKRIPHSLASCMIAGLLVSFCETADSRDMSGDLDEWALAEKTGGGAFGGGGFGGGDAQRFGGSGIGDGHFGGGGLGSVRASGEDTSAARDWQDRGNQVSRPQPQQESQPQHDMDSPAGEAAYSRTGQDYGGAFLPFYYGGSWSGYYNSMTMGELTGLTLGSSISALPRRHDTIMVEGTPYYYSNGVYMIRQNASIAYTLVPPPPGAIVSYLPNACAPVYLESQIYQDCSGAFYLQLDKGWQVVQPPAGIQVNHIPPGAVGKEINGTRYFEFGGVWYQPFFGGSDIIYRVVSHPRD